VIATDSLFGLYTVNSYNWDTPLLEISELTLLIATTLSVQSTV
jgi:hypothetical protein